MSQRCPRAPWRALPIIAGTLLGPLDASAESHNDSWQYRLSGLGSKQLRPARHRALRSSRLHRNTRQALV